VSAGRILNRLLAPTGLVVQRRGPGRATAERGLERLPALGLSPRTVVDIGAAYGEWSALAGRVFSKARVILIEPLSEFAPFLEVTTRGLTDAIVVAAAAGRTPGSAMLHVHRDLVGTSLRSEPGLAAADREVTVLTVDGLVAEYSAKGPFVLKLDVQGAELDVLAGAAATLAETELVQLETLLFPFYDGAPQLAEVVAFMRAAGFVVYDVADLGYRPLDGALAQVDLLFVPESSPLRKRREYATAEQRRGADEALQAVYDRRLRELGR